MRRKPTVLAGVEGGGTTWKAAIALGSPENIVAKTSVDTTTPRETLDKVRQWLVQQIAEYGRFDSLGVASFGPIDAKVCSSTYGYITTTPKTGWQHVDVLGALRFEGIPCKFDTDVNAPALWEFKHNSASGATSCAYITIGTGVGVGLVVNGETVTGLVHPEGGHVALQHGDAGFEGACPFHKDCVEGLTATHALAAKARCDPWDLPGLPNDHQVWDHAAHTIAGLCCTLVYVVSPERIVIGGGVMNRTVLYQLVKDKVKEMLNGYIQNDLILNHIDEYIVPPKMGEDAGIVGALTLAQVALEESNAAALRSSKTPTFAPFGTAVLAALLGVLCSLLVTWISKT